MTNPASELSQQLSRLVEGAAKGVVRVEGRRRRAATGSVWTGDMVLAAHHAVEWEEGIEIGLGDGSRVPAVPAGRDPGTDLVLLKVEGGGLSPLAWAEAGDLEVGHLVLGLSRPGRTVQARLGVLSALADEWRTPAGARVDQYLQSDVPPHPGFSGGPLLDAAGRAVGLNAAGLLRGVATAIPVRTLRRVTEALLAHGQVRRGFLGISSQPVRLPTSLEQKAGQAGGLILLSVQTASPAEAAGLMLGDVLLTIEGAPLKHPSEVFAFLEEDRIGSSLAVRLLRAGEPRELSLVVGARGAAA